MCESLVTTRDTRAALHRKGHRGRSGHRPPVPTEPPRCLFVSLKPHYSYKQNSLERRRHFSFNRFSGAALNGVWLIWLN